MDSSKLIGRESNKGCKLSLVGEVVHIMKTIEIFNENLLCVK